MQAQDVEKKADLLVKPARRVLTSLDSNAENSVDASVRQEEGGQTIIHNDVVAKIAGMAVREVEGVHSLAPHGAGQTLTLLSRRIRGARMRDLGVHVEVGKVEAAVDVRIIVNYGTNIHQVASAVRESVTARVEAMTNLRVVEINIEVVDLHFDVDDQTGATRVR